MKKSFKSIMLIMITAVFAVTAISSVCAYFAMTNEFDHNIFHFAKDSKLAFAATYLPMVTPFIAAACMILLNKSRSFKSAPSTTGIPMTFSSTFVGVMLIISAFIGRAPTESFNASVKSVDLSAWVTVTAIISGVYFLLIPFVKKSFMTLLAFSPVLWAAFSLLEEYFRAGEPINSPVRTANLAMFSFLLLFFAEDIRFGLKNQIVGLYYFCLLSAITFTGAATLPKIAIIIIDNSKFKFDIINWCLCTAMLLFLLSRLATLPAVLGDYVPSCQKNGKNRTADNNTLQSSNSEDPIQ